MSFTAAVRSALRRCINGTNPSLGIAVGVACKLLVEAGNCSRKPVCCTLEAAAGKDEEGPHDGSWVCRVHQIPGGPSLQLWEGGRVFADGAGVHIWPAAELLVKYLSYAWDDPDALPSKDASVRHKTDSETTSKYQWKGRKVLELGCGCGFVALSLAIHGADVVAVDSNEKALRLAGANLADHLDKGNQPVLRYLDWGDEAACEQLRKEFGPFNAIVAADCVLVDAGAGPMWRSLGMQPYPPEQLLEASRCLATCDDQCDTEVVVLVVDRSGDVAATAQALVQRRQEIELVALPAGAALEGGGAATVFHFRWRERKGDTEHTGQPAAERPTPKMP